MLAVTTGESRIIALPPHRRNGVASMLVALGNAGIGVTQVLPEPNNSGAYQLMVDGNREVAAQILEAIGCVVENPHPAGPTP